MNGWIYGVCVCVRVCVESKQRVRERHRMCACAFILILILILIFVTMSWNPWYREVDCSMRRTVNRCTFCFGRILIAWTESSEVRAGVADCSLIK